MFENEIRLTFGLAGHSHVYIEAEDCVDLFGKTYDKITKEDLVKYAKKKIIESIENPYSIGFEDIKTNLFVDEVYVDREGDSNVETILNKTQTNTVYENDIYVDNLTTRSNLFDWRRNAEAHDIEEQAR